ncbi:ankyrin-3-like isoform X3 [Symsagittifera roscoffensis]|uniref:ankyrin-3-like isoform X3 n=1 Tax=Symsagittifera roscoffensis TaxID=84072 RepID=UPI00307C64AF
MENHAATPEVMPNSAGGGKTNANGHASPAAHDPAHQLLKAAQTGNIDKVEELLNNPDSGITVNMANSGGLTALHLAARKNLPEMCAFLLDKGADPSCKSNRGNTALHIAALAGHLTVVKLLVERKCDINSKAQGSFTPLYMAAQENHLDVLKYLLHKGADETVTTEEGFTPLAVALQQQHAKIVATLLEAEHSKKGYKLPALHVAVRKNDEKSTLLLLTKKYDPNIMSSTNFTPLHVAARYGHYKIATHLVNFGAHVDQAAKNSIVPLHVASKWGKVDLVELFVNANAKIDYKTKDGLTGLHCGSRNGHDEVVDKLLVKGADFKIKTKSGLSALHMAAQGNNESCARLLLHHGLPVDDVTKDLLTPLHITAHCGHFETCKFVLERGASPDARALNGYAALHIAVKKRRIRIILLLLREYNADPNIPNESGMTPLHVACFFGFDDCAKPLLDCKARANVQTKNYFESPLHFAVRGGHYNLAQMLLDNGAEVNAEALEKLTPLHIASRNGDLDMVKLLVKRGADIEHEALDNYRPIHMATREGHPQVVEYLLQNKAEPNCLTKKQLSPLHLAAKYDKPEVAQVLLKSGANPDLAGKLMLTPLHVSVHYLHHDVSNILLKCKASPHSVASNGYTPLHIAAKRDNRKDAHNLISYGANVNATNDNGTAPLHLAAREKHLQMIQLLVNSKGDPQIATAYLVTPLHLSAEADSVDCCACLVEQFGVAKDTRTKAGFTPLLTAIHHNNMDVVKYLLRVGCSVHDTNEAGHSALHIAAHQGNTAMVDLLLREGANPNAKTLSGATPLMIAQKKRYIAVINVLKPVTEVTGNITMEMEKDIAQEHKPESIETFNVEDIEEDDSDLMLVDDINGPYVNNEDEDWLNQDDIIFSTTTSKLNTFNNNSFLNPDSRPTSGDIIGGFASRPTSGTSNISGLTISSYRERYETWNRLSVTDLNRMKSGTMSDEGGDDGIDLARSRRAGFFVSFVVTAKGVTQRGARHSGIRIIIPPRRVDEPTRIKCRYIRPEKMVKKYPKAEGEAFAARPLEMDPPHLKFNGTVILEVPHFADLCNGQREIAVLNCSEAGVWTEHTQEPLEKQIEEALNISMATEDQIAQEDLQTPRICRVIMREFPKVMLLISRIKKDVSPIGPKGGLLSSSVHAHVQLSFPEEALKKTIEIGLQVYKMPTDLVRRICGSKFRCSPVVTVEPQRRRFHQVFTVYLPHPSSDYPAWPAGTKTELRVLRSVQAKTDPSVFEDKTESFVLNKPDKDGRIAFTTMISGRYWVIEYAMPENTSSESAEGKMVLDRNLKMAAELYREAMIVPYQAKFFVFGKRHDEQQALVRAFLMLDDKHDPCLENQLNFSLISKSRDISVLDMARTFVEMTHGNLQAASSGIEKQPDTVFVPFRENRIMFFVQVRDDEQAPVGTVDFYPQPRGVIMKRTDEEKEKLRLCRLTITLPDYVKSEDKAGTINFASTDILKKNPTLCDPNLSPNSSHERAMLRLVKVASLLGEDWHMLAETLKIEANVVGIFCEQQDASQRGIAMLRHWAEKEGQDASGFALTRALQMIGREDIVKEAMGPSFKLPSDRNMEEIEAYVGRFQTAKFDPMGKPLESLKVDSSQVVQNGLPSPVFNPSSPPTTPSRSRNPTNLLTSTPSVAADAHEDEKEPDVPDKRHSVDLRVGSLLAYESVDLEKTVDFRDGPAAPTANIFKLEDLPEHEHALNGSVETETEVSQSLGESTAIDLRHVKDETVSSSPLTIQTPDEQLVSLPPSTTEETTPASPQTFESDNVPADIMLSPNETNEKESEPETETIKSLEVSETQSDLVEPQNATDEFTVKEHKSSAEENLENKNYEKENEDRDTEINEKEDAENDNESSPETEQENETVEKTEDDDEASTTEEDESHLLGPKSTNLVSDYNRAHADDLSSPTSPTSDNFSLSLNSSSSIKPTSESEATHHSQHDKSPSSPLTPSSSSPPPLAPEAQPDDTTN